MKAALVVGFGLLSVFGSAYAAESPILDRMASDVTTPYSPTFSPHTYKKYKSRIAEVNRLRINAAVLALQSGKCDVAEYSEIKNRADGPVNDIDFFVSCANGERFFFNERDVRNGVVVASVNDSAWDEGKASDDCLKRLQSSAHKLPFPKGKLDISKHSTIVMRESSDMSLTVNIPVDVKGANGVTSQWWARCGYRLASSPGTIEAVPRRM